MNRSYSLSSTSCYNYLLYSLAGLLFITLLTGSILTSSTTSATSDSVVDEVNITVPVSCSLSGTGMNTHNATIPNGIYSGTYTDPDTSTSYANGIGTTTLKVFCNDNNGFAIYAAGYTGNEIGDTNSNKLVGTVASGNSAIVTGLATTAGNPDVSNWAMKLTLGTDSGDTTGTNALTIDSAPNEVNGSDASFSQYHIVPNEYTKVAHKNSATNMDTTTGGATLTTTYAAYISKTQAADTYSGQVIYTLVHPSSADSNGCNPNATTISEVLCMQDFAHVTSANRDAIIASMTPEQQYTLRDSRDDKTYTIAKYQTKYYDDSTDSELTSYDVFMTQNLDLDIDSNTTYTNLDTDIGYNTSTGTYGTASWTPTRSTYAATSNHIHEWCNGGTWNTQYGYCEDNDTPESYDPGNLYWNSVEDTSLDWSTYYNNCNRSTNTPVCDQSFNPISSYVSSTGTTQYHLGNYYNWAAALATNDSSVYDNYDLVEQSICPAGWTLPRVGKGEDAFYSLWNQYGLTTGGFIDSDGDHVHDAGEDALWTSPLYYTVSGGFDGILANVGQSGRFWSSLTDGYLNAWFANLTVDNYVEATSSLSQNDGNTVRCMARPVVHSISSLF